jgi:hypothetical protein
MITAPTPRSLPSGDTALVVEFGVSVEPPER